MLVLLPPSEGKTAPRRGKPLDLDTLVLPELGELRAEVLDAVDPALAGAPAAPAARVYTGVLFQRLRLGELPKRARRRALIFSGLWGVVQPDDRIPAYKLPIGTKVPGLGGLAAYWRAPLRAALPDAGLVLDLRSGPYAAVWTPKEATVVTVRGFTEAPDGRRTVVSHMVKATRGDVARLVLERPGRAPRTPEQVAEIVAGAGHRVELTEQPRGWALDVIA